MGGKDAWETFWIQVWEVCLRALYVNNQGGEVRAQACVRATALRQPCLADRCQVTAGCLYW